MKKLFQEVTVPKGWKPYTTIRNPRYIMLLNNMKRSMYEKEKKKREISP